jgi:chloramphenicol O-acetyltransferase
LLKAVCCLIPAFTIMDPENRKISVMATGFKMKFKDIMKWNKKYINEEIIY